MSGGRHILNRRPSKGCLKHRKVCVCVCVCVYVRVLLQLMFYRRFHRRAIANVIIITISTFAVEASVAAIYFRARFITNNERCAREIKLRKSTITWRILSICPFYVDYGARTRSSFIQFPEVHLVAGLFEWQRNIAQTRSGHITTLLTVNGSALFRVEFRGYRVSR